MQRASNIYSTPKKQNNFDQEISGLKSNENEQNLKLKLEQKQIKSSNQKEQQDQTEFQSDLKNVKIADTPFTKFCKYELSPLNNDNVGSYLSPDRDHDVSNPQQQIQPQSKIINYQTPSPNKANKKQNVSPLLSIISKKNMKDLDFSDLKSGSKQTGMAMIILKSPKFKINLETKESPQYGDEQSELNNKETNIKQQLIPQSSSRYNTSQTKKEHSTLKKNHTPKDISQFSISNSGKHLHNSRKVKDQMTTPKIQHYQSNRAEETQLLFNRLQTSKKDFQTCSSSLTEQQQQNFNQKFQQPQQQNSKIQQETPKQQTQFSQQQLLQQQYLSQQSQSTQQQHQQQQFSQSQQPFQLQTSQQQIQSLQQYSQQQQHYQQQSQEPLQITEQMQPPQLLLSPQQLFQLQHQQQQYPNNVGRKKICCNCKKSKCLKLYCECFTNGECCGKDCNCISCSNTSQNEVLRNSIMQSLLEKNPKAFFSKLDNANVEDGNEAQKHNKGCNCKKSHCMKKYCECFQAGVKCSAACKCEICINCDQSLAQSAYNYQLMNQNSQQFFIQNPQLLQNECQIINLDYQQSKCIQQNSEEELDNGSLHEQQLKSYQDKEKQTHKKSSKKKMKLNTQYLNVQGDSRSINEQLIQEQQDLLQQQYQQQQQQQQSQNCEQQMHKDKNDNNKLNEVPNFAENSKHQQMNIQNQNKDYLDIEKNQQQLHMTQQKMELESENGQKQPQNSVNNAISLINVDLNNSQCISNQEEGQDCLKVNQSNSKKMKGKKSKKQNNQIVSTEKLYINEQVNKENILVNTNV